MRIRLSAIFPIVIVFFMFNLLHAKQQELSDDFEVDGELSGFITNNANAVPDVQKIDGRYRAEITNNDNNITLHFNEFQGRLDAKLLVFPFEFVARNIGIGTVENAQNSPLSTGNPYIFSGVQVHVPELESRNSSHVVVGHRGSTEFTIEGKNTINGNSSVNDAGEGIVPEGRADIRIVGNSNRTITVYWQLPNSSEDNWVLYNDTGMLPGSAPAYGDSVYVGLITYVFEQGGIPFVGTCDGIEITNQSAVSNELEPNFSSFRLNQNYPNPFNPSTNISFSLLESSLVTLEVFDIQGRIVAVLMESPLQKGQHSINFDASNLSSGSYYARLNVNSESQSIKLMLIK